VDTTTPVDVDAVIDRIGELARSGSTK